MTKLSWGDPGQHIFEAGVDRGVLYLDDLSGVVWNGLISVEETPSDGDSDIHYMDGRKYNKRVKRGDFSATLSAFTYPLEFQDYDGFSDPYLTQQRRKTFNLSYRTLIGNDVKGSELGYKIHLVYNALATPSDNAYSTLASSIDPMAFSWGISTTPVFFPNSFGTAHVVISSTEAYPWVITALEDILYGTDEDYARFPTPEELYQLFEDSVLFKVTDHGDGIATVEGPPGVVDITGPDTARFTYSSVVKINADTYRLTSY